MPNTIYPIRLYGDPILRGKARPIADVNAPVVVPGFTATSLRDVARNMLETMYEARGVGLAAPQIGLGVRMFVAAEYEDDEEEHEGKEPPLKSRVLHEYVMINPVLEVLDKRKELGQEGCLSIPGIYEEDVPRFREVRIRYTDLDGKEWMGEAEDYLARVFQHETDHLSGKLFLDYLPQAVTDSHRKALAEMQRKAKAKLRELEGRAS
ncbi:peptide deformylase [Deinococcus yavapaiensis]|uniref:Peptide deformylase n=1 Tax=Deinococcus yavapaiensis KR-236 TaxID=694435 RepID=A0A318S9Y9_9DEIO|nr:peptide deformylase [Deinococcus yavapaiensis]PYE55689.1 peptide deformylase [Deinococcus yavapaiensis KR-236]